MSTDKTNQSWGGRFSEPVDAFVARFTASVDFDKRLYRHDIMGSIAHATMLAQVGVLNDKERDTIIDGLKTIQGEIEAGNFDWRVDLEDVHMNIEARLTDRIGITGKKLHTGRSRNDQVATDIRLWLRDEIDIILGEITRLQQGLLEQAEREAETIMPGFTHLQTAQPVTFGHHLLAWFEMLSRDYERLVDCRKRANRMPLGSAALAGTTYPIDRELTCKLLGFEAVAGNSLDGVSDRDFAIEFCAAASIAMMHLSRFSEELVLWTSAQFQFIDLPDRFCTGSSIMPQKKNPDVPELVRGKTGRVFGALTGLLTLMKGQPLAYNKDNQEDKEPLFDAADTLRDSLRAFADMIPAIKPKHAIMREAALRGFSTATDLADYLVRRGLPFRDCHEIVGHAVKYGVDTGKDLAEMSLDELRQFSDQIEQDVFAVLTLEGSVNARNHIGGTAPAQVRAAVARGKALPACRRTAAGLSLTALDHFLERRHRRVLVCHDPRHVRVLAQFLQQRRRLREVREEVDVQHFLAHGVSQIDREAEHQVGDGHLLTRHIRLEPPIALERGEPRQQVGPCTFLDQRLHRRAKECLAVAGARRQFDVQLDLPEQFTHFRLTIGISRQQRRARLGLLDIVEDHTRLADEAVLGLQHRHLATRADGQRLGRRAAEERHLFEGHAFLQQGQLDHVVVVADRESMKLEHVRQPPRPYGVGPAFIAPPRRLGQCHGRR